MLRAGPFSDERIVPLVNRRFVPFFFDLATSGAVGDRDALKFVTAARRDLKGGSVPPPDVLLMSAEGKVIAEIGNFDSADAFLAALKKALRDHPGFDRPDPAEEAFKGLDRARLLLDLGDLDGARAAFLGIAGAEAAYWRGRAARMQGDWEEMEKAFGAVDDPSLADDVRMERARRLWQERKYAELGAALKDFPASSNRFTEARYFEGLSLHHRKDGKAALELWKVLVEKRKAEDPWIYRADWAWFSVKHGGRQAFSGAQKGSTPLGRIGYMGNSNPDLKGP